MELQNKQYKVQTPYIIGGGITLREGEIVPAEQLGEYADWFKSQGAIVEIDEATRDERQTEARAG